MERPETLDSKKELIKKLETVDSKNDSVESGFLLQEDQASKIEYAIGKEEIPDELQTLIQKFVSENGLKEKDDQFILLHEWVLEDSTARLPALQNYIAQIIKERGLSANILFVLGDLEQDRKTMFVSEELVNTIETLEAYHQAPGLDYRSLINLFSSNNETDNLNLHKFFDFIYQYGVTVQEPGIIEGFDEKYPYSSWFVSICVFLESNKGNIKNYLVMQRVDDILRMWKTFGAIEDKDALHGVAGGTSDETIYTFKHVEESYSNYILLGIRDGYPIKNPLIEIAPGYLGYYENGKLEKIFKSINDNKENVSIDEKKYIEANNPNDEYIYDVLNKPMAFDEKHKDPSNKLKLLSPFWDFEDDLELYNRKFFYDRSKINFDNLHPMVKGTLLTKNQEYIQRVEGMNDSVKPLSKKETEKTIFPLENINTDRMYLYKQLSQLHMRRKIEKDFNFDISKLDFIFQINFLEFLETKDIDDVHNLKNFVKSFGITGIKTFLSLEQNKNFGNSILKIGEKIEVQTAKKIFDKYSELVSQLDNVENILAESYGKEENSEEVIKIKDSILHKGKDLLVHFSDIISQKKEISAEKIIDDLQKIDAEAVTFFLAFKTLKEANGLPELKDIIGISFEEKKATELSPEDQKIIIKMYSENYTNNPELLKELLAKFKERTDDPNTKFYLLKHGGKLRACIGFTPIDGEKATYMHSVNVESSLQGSSIGKTMMEIVMNNEASKSVLKADCAAYEKIGAKYIETGFIGTSFYLYNENPSLSIVRDEKKNQNYWGKQILGKEEELIEFISKGELPKNVLVESAQEQKGISMEALSKGYVLTRYFNDKTTKKWYAIFEKGE